MSTDAGPVEVTIGASSEILKTADARSISCSLGINGRRRNKSIYY
jgi:hypothetical protein